jgi:predicted RNase H-like HicB family nuclease
MIPNYSVSIKWSDEDNEFVAVIPELPLISGLGSTREKAVKQCMEAAALALDVLKEEGRPLPQPRKIVPYSGQLRLRMPRYLHARLAELAEQEGMSLNSYIVYLLTRGSTVVEVTGQAAHPAAAIKPKQAAHRRLARTG